MKKQQNSHTIRSSAAEYLTFVASTGDNPQNIEMRYENENIRLTQKMLATLCDVDVRTTNEYIQKILDDKELENDGSTIRNFRIVQTERNRQAKFHAESEFEKYRIVQDRLYESDFDRFCKLESEVKQIKHNL